MTFNWKKSLLVKCLKMLVSDDLLKNSMTNFLEHCLNLPSSPFNIFVNQ